MCPFIQQKLLDVSKTESDLPEKNGYYTDFDKL